MTKMHERLRHKTCGARQRLATKGPKAQVARVALACATGALLGTPGLAEEIKGNHSQLGYSLGIESGTNLDLRRENDDYESRLNAGLTYDYSRATQSSELHFGSDLLWRLEDGGETVFLPKLALDYKTQSARDALSFGLNYTRTEVTDQSVSYDETGSVLDYDGRGQRGVADLKLGYQGGIDSPVSFSVGYRYTDLQYYDTQSTSYSNSQRAYYDLGLTLTPNASSSYQLALHYDDYNVDNITETERQTSSVSVLTTQRLDAVTTLQFGVGYSDVQTDRITYDERVNGAIFNLGLEREDRLGTYGVMLSSQIEGSGRRQELSASRKRALQNGTLSAMVGLSASDEGDTNWIGALSLSHELPRDKLSLLLRRRVYSNDDNEDVVVTRISAKVSHDLSEVSALNFGLSASTNEQENGTDSRRIDASVSLSRELARDTQLSAGLSKRYSKDTADRTADSEMLFVTLEKDLDFLH
ncbi:hypothetical protein RPE78_16390 (plasmid) [Thioclava litoralis]|uniref:Beta-barrel porin 2 n=1 Tax=Thioclava litoralis TaxID=3076557 RepID=A0ABZ1E516_9RHOB|nr:hypothetical protein RPE78_16390 [Thioclava sp. FTW29]